MALGASYKTYILRINTNMVIIFSRLHITEKVLRKQHFARSQGKGQRDGRCLCQSFLVSGVSVHRFHEDSLDKCHIQIFQMMNSMPRYHVVVTVWLMYGDIFRNHNDEIYQRLHIKEFWPVLTEADKAESFFFYINVNTSDSNMHAII